MNFTTLLEMINASEAREDDPEFQSPGSAHGGMDEVVIVCRYLV